MTENDQSMRQMFHGAYAGKKVFVTGHTGFKGSWLCEWLLGLGAEVTGFSLPPPTQPALFDQLGLAARLRHQLGDIRDRAALGRALAGEGELMAWQHNGFWQPMDTFQEFTLLNRLWSEGNAPWKVWE